MLGAAGRMSQSQWPVIGWQSRDEGCSRPGGRRGPLPPALATQRHVPGRYMKDMCPAKTGKCGRITLLPIAEIEGRTRLNGTASGGRPGIPLLSAADLRAL